MLLDFDQLIVKYKMKVTGAAHIGCHWAQEIPMYHKHGIKDIALVEPAAAAFKVLKAKYGAHHHIRLFNVACASYCGKGVLHTETANQGQSNSLLKPKNHLKQYPSIQFGGKEEVRVVTLDSLQLGPKFNLLNMDVQCCEMQVLQGAKETLKHIDYIISEVNAPGADLYEGCTDIDEMDKFLSAYGFQRPENPEWIGGTWSDSFWIKRLPHA